MTLESCDRTTLTADGIVFGVYVVCFWWRLFWNHACLWSCVGVDRLGGCTIQRIELIDRSRDSQNVRNGEGKMK
jgi:hypothetical protein